jgi:hypothetical protein
MKKLFLSLVTIAAMAMAFTESKIESATAKVDKYYNVDLYAFSEPTVEYEVMEEKTLTLVKGCRDWFFKPARQASQAGADGVIIIIPPPGTVETVKYKIIKYKN